MCVEECWDCRSWDIVLKRCRSGHAYVWWKRDQSRQSEMVQVRQRAVQMSKAVYA